MLTTKRRPLNTQTINYCYTSVNKGMWGNGEYVSLLDIRGECEDAEACLNSDEHLTYDGQFFYRKPEAKC